MKKNLITLAFVGMACALLGGPKMMLAQQKFAAVSADAFNRAVPDDFYLEGNRIPVEKRNAAVLQNGQHAQVILGLLDTSGYSSQVQQKYSGMLITEAKIAVCGIAVGVGSYGFGLERPAPAGNEAAHFRLYNQAGEKLGECAAPRDDRIKQPKPLAVGTAPDGSAELYLGKYALQIR